MSDDHISTTHIGSLPRDPELLDLLQRRQDGEDVDPEQWHQTVQDATESVVRKQADVGLDVVNNGEQPRVSFNWYVANRLSGIGGERDAPLWDDLADFPEYASDAFDTETIDLTKQPSVTGPVVYDGTEAVDEEIETFADALDAVDADFEGTFLTAASPGVAAATLVNEYYDSHEEFVHAVGDALREEYEAIADTGAILHLDAPDLLTTGHRGFGDRPSRSSSPSSACTSQRSTKPPGTSPTTRFASTPAGGATKAPTTATRRSWTCSRNCTNSTSAGSPSRKPTPATNTSTASSRNTRFPTAGTCFRASST
ncbi:hypothetical protein LPA46_15745 [Halobacterium sp. KA-6]|nr:hypothetical protein [Halobacterium sp. KA-6]MCD2204778.1 hypothetical protein [Halobacterium sp. KA-6]